MKTPVKSSSFVTVLAMLMLMAFGAQVASAQHYRGHHGERRFHVWRNDRWVWEWHPANWVIPAWEIGPAQVDINLGWSNHPGWHRYRVYRHGHWDYVYHPAGWTVPGAWRGPHHHDR